MLTANEVYKKYVLEDLKLHKGLYHPKNASILERLKVRQIPIEKLHPNPEDEFSIESIGPNWEIVVNYETSIRYRGEVDLDIFEEPLMAVKLNKGGYMLLNGHHRWLAALNNRVKKVPVKVVNITHEKDISEAINKSNRNKCVTIDFDEVLFSDELQSEENQVAFPFNKIYKKNIRENSALLVSELQRLGYDVWIYTGSYLSEQYIKGLFSLNKCKIDGMVNGLNGKRKSNNLKEIFREKYELIVHVDNEMITLVNPRNKKYEMIEFNVPKEEWASAVVTNVGDFNLDVLA